VDIDLRAELQREFDGHIFSHTVNQSTLEKILDRFKFYKEWLEQKIIDWIL
jgi:hypothetical protein